MVTVYKLADDRDSIARIQKATLTTDDFGIRQTHGLFGSPEWWAKIASGELLLETIRGTISKVYMGSMGDWPEFQVETSDGTKESFTRWVSRREMDREYRNGRLVEIDFVWQFHKKAWSGDPKTKVILEIRVE